MNKEHKVLNKNFYKDEEKKNQKNYVERNERRCWKIERLPEWSLILFSKSDSIFFFLFNLVLGFFSGHRLKYCWCSRFVFLVFLLSGTTIYDTMHACFCKRFTSFSEDDSSCFHIRLRCGYRGCWRRRKEREKMVPLLRITFGDDMGGERDSERLGKKIGVHLFYLFLTYNSF